MSVARQDFHLDLYTMQYVPRPSPRTVLVRKVKVRILLEDRFEYGATQLDDEAFVAPAAYRLSAWERRRAAQV